MASHSLLQTSSRFLPFYSHKTLLRTVPQCSTYLELLCLFVLFPLPRKHFSLFTKIIVTFSKFVCLHSHHGQLDAFLHVPTAPGSLCKSAYSVSRIKQTLQNSDSLLYSKLWIISSMSLGVAERGYNY